MAIFSYPSHSSHPTTRRKAASWVSLCLILLATLCACGSSEPTFGPADELPPAGPLAGMNALFIGHSFFRPMADGMPFHTEEAGIEGHRQTTVFAGGQNGAPMALWNNESKRSDIQAALDQGDVDLFGMTYEPTYPTTEGYEKWISYALEKNPKTRFFIALPWSDFPAQTDTKTYADTWLSAHENEWHDFIDSIRALYPGVNIFCIPYGQAALELRNLYDVGELPDVTTMTGDKGEAIFTDKKGHPGDILTDLGRLVWLRAIYNVDLGTYAHDTGYQTDLKVLAQSITDEHEEHDNAQTH